MKKREQSLLQDPHIWTFTTYFAEGFPYTIIRIISSVFFRDMRVSLESIGLTSLFGLPWVLKFLWGPYIDHFGTKRRWMLSMQGLLVLMVLVTALLATIPGGIKGIAILFFVGSILAATHDMAIDGYYLEALDEKGQARFVGYRVMAYRIAMMTGTGLVVTIGAAEGWVTGFLFAGGLLLLLFLYHFFLLPRVEIEKEPIKRLFLSLFSMKALFAVLAGIGLVVVIQWLFLPEGAKQRIILPAFLMKLKFSDWVVLTLLVTLVLLGLFKQRIKNRFLSRKESFYSRAFIAYMDREGIGIALAFIILMRAGESMLTSMAAPFIVDLGMKVHYGWISGGVGLPFSIFGALIGGWAISRYGLKKTIWPFLFGQNLTNLVYMLLALHLNSFVILNTANQSPIPIGTNNIFWVATVHAFDQFAGGLGTAVLTTFLMRTCLPEFKAAHFAIGTGLMNVCGVLAGVMSGYLASWLGYGWFFGVSFLASVPGMILLFFIPMVDQK